MALSARGGAGWGKASATRHPDQHPDASTAHGRESCVWQHLLPLIHTLGLPTAAHRDLFMQHLSKLNSLDPVSLHYLTCLIDPKFLTAYAV